VTGKFKYPQIYILEKDTDNNTEILTQITSEYLGDTLKLNFRVIYWSDSYRYLLRFNKIMGDDIVYTVHAYDYSTSSLYQGTFVDGVDKKIDLSKSPTEMVDDFTTYVNTNDFNFKFEKLLSEKLGLDIWIIFKYTYKTTNYSYWNERKLL